MSTYKVGLKAATKEIEVIPQADAFTASFTSIGTFDHEDLVTGVDDADDALGDAPENHVIWHHIRDLLYAAGKLDPSAYKILIRKVTALSSSPATATKAPAATQQITNTFTPANALDKRVTYESSDVTKATVNASGLVTAVATGSATITVTHVATGLQDTLVLTIS